MMGRTIAATAASSRVAAVASAAVTSVLFANCLSLAIAGEVHAQEVDRNPSSESSGNPSSNPSRLDRLEQQVQQQTARVDALREALDQQERSVAELQRALANERLDATRARGARSGVPDVAQHDVARQDVARQADAPPVADASAATPAVAANAAVGQDQAAPPQPVGRAPESESRPPEIAQIFEQPGVLTPKGKFVIEPSFQFGYSSSDRVALVGFTVIPAILIGLIDVRQVKTSTAVATLTGRYGLTNRLEVEAKLPYVYIYGDTVSREIFTGSAVDNVFNASGHGLGDAEFTVRYQFEHSDPDRPYFIGWLRYKSRSGTDLFEVLTDCVQRCVGNTTGTGLPLELPTGSGFEAIQPGLTWLYASDPVVFFGSFSYLHNFERHNVSRTVLAGLPGGAAGSTTEFIGDVEAGDILGFNVGMGLALNEKAAISIGYDQSLVGKTEQNDINVPGSVRVILGTLVLGASYRFSDRVSLNVALGVGVTDDTPDVTLTARLPISF